MFRVRAVLAIGAVSLLVVSWQAQPPTLPQPSNCASGLLGTWRIVSYEDADSTGHITTPYGPTPKGYLVYDRTGHMSIQVTISLPLTKWPGDTSEDAAAHASLEELRKGMMAYEAYSGRYEVDCRRSVVIHLVELALHRTYVGTRQERPFRLHGDSLVLGVPPTWRRVFLRVR